MRYQIKDKSKNFLTMPSMGVGFLVRLDLGHSFGDAAMQCSINTCIWTYIYCIVYMYSIVYMYCFEYYVSCWASTRDVPDNAALSDEFLVWLHVALGPTLEMLL